jgi:hypothetical protein
LLLRAQFAHHHLSTGHQTVQAYKGASFFLFISAVNYLTNTKVTTRKRAFALIFKGIFPSPSPVPIKWLPASTGTRELSANAPLQATCYQGRQVGFSSLLMACSRLMQLSAKPYRSLCILEFKPTTVATPTRTVGPGIS